MITAVTFVLAAAAGAVLRYVAAVRLRPTSLPWGTLAVNLTGSFLLGLIAGWSPPVATVAGTASLGALTTFSTFAGELVAGWERSPSAVGAYATVSVVGGVALAWLGLAIAG